MDNDMYYYPCHSISKSINEIYQYLIDNNSNLTNGEYNLKLITIKNLTRIEKKDIIKNLL